MKKIIAFLTKGSKIRRILVYVYRGLVVSRAAFIAGFEALKIERPEDKAYAKLENIPEYLDTAAKAVKKILKWMGGDTEEIEALASREATLIAGETNLPTLADITSNLKD